MVKLKFVVVVSGILILCSACSVMFIGHGSQDTESPVNNDPNNKGILVIKDWKTYTVQQGDTLYRIALRFKKDVSVLAQLNGLQHPYTIRPEQVLRIEPLTQYPIPSGSSTTIGVPPQTPTKQLSGRWRTEITPPSNSAECSPPVQWQWPTYGEYEKVLSESGYEGILIWGQAGQAVMAAASGKVTYSGSGYGDYPNAIVIQHNSAFSSIYAFNRKHHVQENTLVTGGQAIAEMGTHGNGRAVLHFEIRCYGKTLDPLSYLPR